MTWGVLGFAASAPVSIAASQICVGVTALGLGLSLATRRVRYRPGPLDLPILIFLLVEIAAAALAVNRRWSLPALEDDWPLLLVLLFSQALRDFAEARRALLVLLLFASVGGALSVWQMVMGTDPILHRPIYPIGSYFIGSGFFGGHLTFGGIMLIAAMLSVTILSGDFTRRRVWALVFLQLCGVLASLARTAWLGLAAGVLGLALATRGWVRRASIALLGLGALSAILVPPIRLRLAEVLKFNDDPRVRLWATALRIWKTRPILGSGPGAFKLLFERFKVPGWYMATGHPHNDFLKILDNSGIVGMAAFALLWTRFFRHVVAARRGLEPADPRRVYLLGGILVVVALLVGALGQCFLSDEAVADVFWFTVAATLVAARE